MATRNIKERLIKRWGEILDETQEDIPILVEKYGVEHFRKVGYYANGLKDQYARVARLDYLLNHDIASFKKNLALAAECQIELFEIFKNRKPTDPPNPGLDPMHPSLFTMFKFCKLLDALASGDIEISIRIAWYMGDRPDIEEAYDDEFILSLGYSLKYAVEDNKSQLQLWLPRLKSVCEDPEYKVKEFIGYYFVLEALLENNLEKANWAFTVLIVNHKKRCQKKVEAEYPFSEFYDSPDADLFVWGIGLANLCRHHGLNVVIDDPLIPEELLIPISDCQAGYKLAFKSYWEGFLINDTRFILRFATPTNWQVYEEHENKDISTIICPGGEDFNLTELFVSTRMYKDFEKDRDYPGRFLSIVENSFLDIGWAKEQSLSVLDTYDKRAFSALFFKDKDLEYSRKIILISIKEDPSLVLQVAFQVNSINKQDENKYFPLFEDIIRSLKFQEENLDQQEKQEYMMHLATSKEIIKSIMKLYN